MRAKLNYAAVLIFVLVFMPILWISVYTGSGMKISRSNWSHIPFGPSSQFFHMKKTRLACDCEYIILYVCKINLRTYIYFFTLQNKADLLPRVT